MRKGTFVISLDFELYWGVRDHRTLESYGSNIANVHKVVPELLTLFSEHNIHCTWATVGFLFCNTKEELEKIIPSAIPQYEDKTLDPYSYIFQNSLQDKYHFAPGLIEKISSTIGQEIGTHTLSHYYTLEKGADATSFYSDIHQAVKLAGKHSIKINSIVFPRNQYSEEFLKVCAENNIKVFRGTERSWIYNTRSRTKETKFRRLIRLLDSYFNISGHHTSNPSRFSGLVNIPASRFLRPYNPRLDFLESFRLKRIKTSMEYAAKKGEIFHLWWHPHNFGSYTNENLAMLNKIISHYKRLEKKYQMQSLNMAEIAELIN